MDRVRPLVWPCYGHSSGPRTAVRDEPSMTVPRRRRFAPGQLLRVVVHDLRTACRAHGRQGLGEQADPPAGASVREVLSLPLEDVTPPGAVGFGERLQDVRELLRTDHGA